MLSAASLKSIARARLKDADALFTNHRYDGAVYLCGYAVEIAIKARVLKTLKWSGFPETRNDFEGLQSFKSHDLQILLKLSGREAKIINNYQPEWSHVSNWDPQSRYRIPGIVTRTAASDLIVSTKTLVGVLL